MQKEKRIKIRKYADFLPEKNKIDKELLSTFFSEEKFQHDSLGYTAMNTSDTIKSILFYFKKNVIDVKNNDSTDSSNRKKDIIKRNILLE